MPVVTIPFDYEQLGDKSSVVPICINDTDRNGRTIAWGWISAVEPIADRLRSLARRRLDDVWRVSELTEESVHDLWYTHGEDLGIRPQWRVYAQAKWKAEDLRYGSWRVRKGREVALGKLEATLRARTDHGAEFERQEMVDMLRQQLRKRRSGGNCRDDGPGSPRMSLGRRRREPGRRADQEECEHATAPDSGAPWGDLLICSNPLRPPAHPSPGWTIGDASHRKPLQNNGIIT